MDYPKITVLLPIKEHSSRVPGKNFRSFCGQPLYIWILDTLARCRLVKKVIISTDSWGLIEILRKQKETWPEDWLHTDKRPVNLCGDDVSVNSLWLELLPRLGYTDPGEIFLQTHTTNPLLKCGTIDQLIERFQIMRYKHDSLFTVSARRSRFYGKNGMALNHDPKKLIPTQELEPLYEENSCAYVFSLGSFLKHEHRIGAHPLMEPISDEESTDIDWENDFIVAECLMKLRLKTPLIKELHLNQRPTVLITGIKGGIGSVLGKHYIEKGWQVVGLDKGLCQDRSLSHYYLDIDLTKKDAVSSVPYLLDGHGVKKLNLLVHCAGGLLPSYQETLTVNLGAPFQLSVCLYSRMPPESSIVMISSVHAQVTSIYMGIYPASKAGLVGLTRSMALDLKDLGIRVNAILPGAIETPLLNSHLDKQKQALLKDRTPANRLGQPEDVAKALDFLADYEKSSFINGTTLVVDGGASIQLATEV